MEDTTEVVRTTKGYHENNWRTFYSKLKKSTKNFSSDFAIQSMHIIAASRNSNLATDVKNLPLPT